MITVDPLAPAIEPKAGKLGVSAIMLYGVAAILISFVAAYFWTDGDERLAAAIGVASIAIPVTAGFFVSELWNQRAGALAFVVTAAVLAGTLSAWAYDERGDYENRRDLIAPGVSSTDAPAK